MSYYVGDYRGDWYRGDPGFFSFLGKAVKGLAGSVLGLGSATKVVEMAPRGIGAIVPKAGAIVRKGGQIVAKHPVLSAAGAAGVIGLGGAAAERAMMRRAPGMRRRRRMRVTNVKALRRSIRRVHGFSKLARRVISFTHPRQARGRMTFRARRRKRVA